MKSAKKIFCAIDTPDLARAEYLTRTLLPVIDHFKLGLEFFTAHGPDGVKKIRAAAGHDARLFLDLKLHDIPNTVASAVRAASALGVDFLTLHTGGGTAMLRAAVDAAKTGKNPLQLLGVTVLTSLSSADMAELGIADTAEHHAERLAVLGAGAGLSGFVCSAHEIARLRKVLPQNAILVVPGIRPKGAPLQDQTRVMTPDDAFTAGADYLVIGRPITQDSDPLAAAKACF